MLTIPVLGFAKHLEKHETFAFRRSSDWQQFYADVSDDIYDTYEWLYKIKKSVTGVTEHEKSALLTYLNTLEPQVIKFMDLMADAMFESHEYDRLWPELCGMVDDMSAIKTQLS